MTIKRISPKELRKLGQAGKIAEAIPLGTPPVLRASWGFARKMADRFNRELLKNRARKFLENLVKRFV